MVVIWTINIYILLKIICDMKVLVTGGAGFIGSNLVDKLIDLGYEVVIIDNLLTGSKENINPKAEFYEIDIRDLKDLEEVFKKHLPEYVFHLAAGYLVQSLDNPQRDAEINIIGTINLIEMCLKYNVKKIIYSNSGGASYGEPKKIPIIENHSINPLTPYGASKYTAEMYLYMYYKNHSLNYTALRYANIYGPRQNPKLEGGVVCVFLDALLKGKRPIMKSDGTLTRDYVYVGDVVDANILAMKKGKCEGYHVSTGIETNVLNLFKIMQKVVNTDLEVIRGEPRIGDPKRAVFDNSKIKRDLDWEPKISLEQGVRKTMEWMQKSMQKNKKKRKAIILAAGIGQRMRPLTNNIPKPLLFLDNKPIIRYTLDLLKKYRFSNIKITTFYLKDKIIDYLKDGGKFGINISYLKEPELISSGQALKEIENFVDDKVLIINADNLTDIDLSKLIDFHNLKKADITIVSYLRNPEAPASSIIEFNKNNQIINFIDKSTNEQYNKIPEDKRFSNSGIYILEKQVFKSIPLKTEDSIGKLLEILTKKYNSFVYFFNENEFYKELGKIDRYLKTKKDLESKKLKLNI